MKPLSLLWRKRCGCFDNQEDFHYSAPSLLCESIKYMDVHSTLLVMERIISIWYISKATQARLWGCLDLK